MWYVYRGLNATTNEVYYGVSKDPKERINGSHCDGGTVTLKHWDCSTDKISWKLVSKHPTQEEASAKAHGLERTQHPKPWKVFKTGGI